MRSQSHGLSLLGALPRLVKVVPTSWWRIPHGQLPDYSLVAAIAGHVALTDVTTDGNVDQDSELAHESCAWGFLGSHDGTTIDKPE